VPWKSLVPDLVTTLMSPPVERPNSGAKPLVTTWNSWTASMGMVKFLVSREPKNSPKLLLLIVRAVNREAAVIALLAAEAKAAAKSGGDLSGGSELGEIAVSRGRPTASFETLSELMSWLIPAVDVSMIPAASAVTVDALLGGL